MEGALISTAETNKQKNGLIYVTGQ